jgi:hypothetical protein
MYRDVMGLSPNHLVFEDSNSGIIHLMRKA